MAQVTAQSELMTQTVAAQAIDYSEDFFVVHDASNQPMMFSIGDQGILYAILVGASGHNELVQLNDKFRIPTSSTVTALTVTQDPDGTTYLVVAEHIGSTANDKIHVMSGVPADFDWTSTSDLSDYLFKDVSSSIPTIANEVAKVKSFLQVKPYYRVIRPQGH